MSAEDPKYDDIESESESGESVQEEQQDDKSLKSALKPSSNPVTAETQIQRPPLPPQTDPKDLDVKTLSPLTPEIIARQATINIGTIGHVAHGKSTVVKAISG